MTLTRARRAAGFTLIEAAVVVAILAILAAVGIPSMSNWLLARRVQAAAGYYADGFMTARNTAIQQNMASRLVLATNAASGQMQWQVDLCLPSAALPCDDTNGSWSTPTVPVHSYSGQNVYSVTLTADSLPPLATMAATLSPSGADTVYFTPTGWLSPSIAQQLTRIVLSPSYQHPNAFAPVAVALTLSGVASRCDPSAAPHDPKGCPP